MRVCVGAVQTAAILTCSRRAGLWQVFSRANRSGRIVATGAALRSPERVHSTRAAAANRLSPEPTPGPIVKFREIGLRKFFPSRKARKFSLLETSTILRFARESAARRAVSVCVCACLKFCQENRDDVAEKSRKIGQNKNNFPPCSQNKTLKCWKFGEIPERCTAAFGRQTSNLTV